MTEMNNVLDNDDLKAILNAITDGILITDGLGYVVWVNQTCEQLAQLPSAKMIGKHMDELEKKQIFLPSVTKLVLEERQNRSTVQSAGNNQKFMVSGNPIKDKEGNIKLIVAHARDLAEVVKDSKENEELLALLNRYSQEIVKNNFNQYEKSNHTHYTGDNKQYLHLLATVDRIAATDSTVLITGETGTGKNMLAQRIHHLSDRRNEAFIEVNCGAIPESLIESELFGYAKGAFTGASTSGKAGLIQLADHGTLFLDEIGELPLHLQAKLLQFLQSGSFRPIGADGISHSNARVITATNADLMDKVKKDAFRSDLFYRLNVLPIHVPALRERKEDIFGLLTLNMKKYNAKYKRTCHLSPEASNLLQAYEWPGNIRELENLVERLVVISPEDKITLQDLPFQIREQKENYTREFLNGKSLTERLDQIEKSIITDTFQKCQTTREMAEKLGITQSLLMRRLKKYQISRD